MRGVTAIHAAALILASSLPAEAEGERALGNIQRWALALSASRLERRLWPSRTRPAPGAERPERPMAVDMFRVASVAAREQGPGRRIPTFGGGRRDVVQSRAAEQQESRAARQGREENGHDDGV